MLKRNIRVEIFIKILLTTLFVIVAIVSNNSHFYQPYYKNIQYSEVQDIAILGGSNVMYGISARLLLSEKRYFNIKNYSIPNEGRNFSLYVKWVSSSLKKSSVIIYSSIDFWILSQDSGDLDQEYQYLPYRPIIIDLYSYFKSIFYQPKKIFRRKFDDFGDLLNGSFKCNKKVKTFNIEKLKGGLSDSKLNSFINRINFIKSIFGSDKVIFRIPPLYINKKDEFVFKRYIENIHDKLKKNNIEVIIPSFVLYFDNKFVCNAAHHPTSEMRAILTKELSSKLIDSAKAQ